MSSRRGSPTTLEERPVQCCESNVPDGNSLSDRLNVSLRARSTPPPRSALSTRTCDAGFVLLPVLVLLLLGSLWVMIATCRIQNSVDALAGTEARLHAEVAATSCIALARGVLEGTEPEQLLTGPNGSLDCSGAPDRRNPVERNLLYERSPEEISCSCDDGLSSELGQTDLTPGIDLGDGSWVFLRFSNNPEEPPDQDEDGILIVRCWAVAPLHLHRDATGRSHPVAMVEARLRKVTAGSGKQKVQLVYLRPLFPEMEGVF